MPAKPLSINELRAEFDKLSLLREKPSRGLPDIRNFFNAELINCRVNRILFERIKRALEITTAEGVILPHIYTVAGANRSSFKDPVKRQQALKRFLSKIEAVRPIVEKLSSKAKEHGLTARLAIHPYHLAMPHPFPTLVFSDAKGEVFWADFKPTGKSLTVNHIQGLKCRKDSGEVDNQKLARVKSALERMGYDRLRDGLFRDLCRASTGRFERVHYLNPSKDPSFQIKPGLFYAFARRQKMKRTKTRATKDLPKPRRRKG